jgi:hypothetical protein
LAEGPGKSAGVQQSRFKIGSPRRIAATLRCRERGLYLINRSSRHRPITSAFGEPHQGNTLIASGGPEERRPFAGIFLQRFVISSTLDKSSSSISFCPSAFKAEILPPSLVGGMVTSSANSCSAGRLHSSLEGTLCICDPSSTANRTNAGVEIFSSDRDVRPIRKRRRQS